MAKAASYVRMIPTRELPTINLSGRMQLYLLSPKNSAAWLRRMQAISTFAESK